MNLDATALLMVYQLILLCAALPKLVTAARTARHWIDRYHRLPGVLQQPIKQGLLSAVKHFIREEWPKLIVLAMLLLILAGLTIAMRVI